MLWATKFDWHPFYLVRGQLCRVAHHPGDLGHFLAATQMGYSFLKTMKEVFEIIKENNTEEGLRKLYEEATIKFPLPSPR